MNAISITESAFYIFYFIIQITVTANNKNPIDKRSIESQQCKDGNPDCVCGEDLPEQPEQEVHDKLMNMALDHAKSAAHPPVLSTPPQELRQGNIKTRNTL